MILRRYSITSESDAALLCSLDACVPQRREIQRGKNASPFDGQSAFLLHNVPYTVPMHSVFFVQSYRTMSWIRSTHILGSSRSSFLTQLHFTFHPKINTCVGLQSCRIDTVTRNVAYVGSLAVIKLCTTLEELFSTMYQVDLVEKES